MSERILVIESDKTFAKGLRYSLEQDNYIIDILDGSNDAIDYIQKKNYDMVLMELNLPDINGLTLCQNIRNVSSVPIIIITDISEDIKKILALEYGADDYIIKPFNILELKARIKAILRRINHKVTDSSNSNIIEEHDITINSVGRKVTRSDKNISLTGKEFDLLYILASEPGRVFTREELLEVVWGFAYYGDLRTVDVHIRRIREKVERDPKVPEYVLTKWGVGYYFKEN